MAFNISEFKSRMDGFGGPARTSLFTVQLIGGPGIGNQFITGNDLMFFCKNVTLPGIDITTFEHRQNAIDIPQSMPVAINAEPLACIFMLDSDHRILSFFHSWMQRVVNYSTTGGNFASVNDQLPYELGYKDEYTCRMIITYYSTTATTRNFYEVVLDDVFPRTVGNIDLGWDNNNSFATLPVSFSYGRIRYTAEAPGTPTSRFARGTGLLDLITAIGSVSQTISQTSRPRSIQDALDQFTRISSSVNRLANVFR
jgi:hypothetical protein